MPVSKVYKHEDTYDTKCKLCDKNEIGDEFHYLLFVPYFRETVKDCSKSITENFLVCINLLNYCPQVT